MTAPVHLPIIGKVKMYEISKEQLLEFWKGVIEKTGLQIRLNERLESLVMALDQGFMATTSKGTYKTNHVLLALRPSRDSQKTRRSLGKSRQKSCTGSSIPNNMEARRSWWLVEEIARLKQH